MDKPLVTLDTFSDPIRAQLIKNRLEGAGIPAYLEGDTAVGAFAGLGSSLASIKLEVAEPDLKRARELLSRPAEPLDEEEAEDKLEEIDPNSTEAVAARALRAAVLGIILLPPLVNIYSLWLILKVVFRDENLSKTASRKVYAAVAVDGLVLLAVALFIRAIIPF
jgi:putative signal transducing protein